MSKLIHAMIRVYDLNSSIDFYQEALGLEVAERYDFDDFSLVYLSNAESDFELELTFNKNQQEPYSHGSGYGHIAVSVEDLETIHQDLVTRGLNPNEIKTLSAENGLSASFFFITDPDGYQIEFIQRGGRFN